MLTPLTRRTWALVGHTPVQDQRMDKREKVSVAGAIWLPPQRDHLGWFSHTLVNAYYDNEAVAVFVEGLLAAVGERLVLLWDGGPMHKGEPIRQLLAKHRGVLTLESLPPYAPEVSPIEPAWSWLKYGRLSNFAPRDVAHLHSEVLEELRSLHRHQKLLRGFFKASELQIPRALLT